MPIVAGVRTSPVSIGPSPRTVWTNTDTTNAKPCRISHCVCCVINPRFETRFRRIRGDSSGVPPERSTTLRCRTNRPRKTNPSTTRGQTGERLPGASSSMPAGVVPETVMPQPYVPVSRTPTTSRTTPSADSAAPATVEAVARPAGSRIHEPAAEEQNDDHDQRLDAEGHTPARQARDQTPDQWPGCRADARGRADRAEDARSSDRAGDEHRGEDVDGRDEQRRPDALADRIAEHEHARSARRGGDQGAGPVDKQADRETPLSPDDIRELAARDHQGRHREREQRDRGLDHLDARPEVGGDLRDRDVRARPREAAQELGQDQ